MSNSALYRMKRSVKIGTLSFVICLALAALLVAANILSGFMFQKTFVTKHTVANKLTGILLFLFPFSLSLLPLEYGAIAVCSMATIAAIHEGIYMKTDKQ